MPKRSAEEKIKHYEEKIRKVKEKTKKHNFRRLRIIDSDSSDEERNDHEIVFANAEVHQMQNLRAPSEEEDQILFDIQPDIMAQLHPDVLPETEPLLVEPAVEQSPEVVAVSTCDSGSVEPALDPELLSALGESVEDTPEYGAKIHDNLAKIWLPILKKGLVKEKNETFIKDYLPPDNCKLLQAPKLNAEISAAVPEIVKNRDKVLMTQQQQLGSGITAINRGMDVLLRGDNKKEAIQHLSNGCRILSDLHAFFTQNRIKLLSPSLDKNVLHVIQETERDETLFGQKLSESIKAAKTIQRQGQQIKKASNTKTPSTSHQVQRHSYSGNWNTPPRYQHNRANRGGLRRGSYQGRRPYANMSTAAAAPQSTTGKPPSASKPRASTT